MFKKLKNEPLGREYTLTNAAPSTSHEEENPFVISLINANAITMLSSAKDTIH
jgi:hypothetical protein